MQVYFEHDGFAIGNEVVDIYSRVEGTIDAIVVYAYNAPEYRIQHHGKFESTWVPGGRIRLKTEIGLRRNS